MIVLTGDFNHNLLKYGDDTNTTRFLNLMLELNYHPTITGPTRLVDSHNPSLVDNIFTNNITDPIAGNILEKISYDHLPNFLSFKLRNPRKNNIHIKLRDKSNFDETNYRQDLLNLN